MVMRIGGLASGMDIDQTVRELMNAERIPLNKMLQQKQMFEWQRADYRSINLSLSTFRDAVFDMRMESTFNSYDVSSNASAVTGKTTANSVPGTYQVDVVTLAKSAKTNSEATVLNQSGTAAKSSDLVLQAGKTETFQVTTNGGLTATITVNDQDTFGSLAAKMASAVDDTTGESLNLRASFDDTTSRFFISTKDMGGDEGFTIENTKFIRDSVMMGKNNLSATGQYGEITFDGITVNNLKSNTVTVNGLTMDLFTEGQSATLTVTTNTQPVIDKIKSFVEAYNAFVADTEKEYYEERYRDFPPLTTEQKESMSDKEIELWEEKARSGMLKGDRLIGDVLTDLRSSVMEPVAGLPAGTAAMLSEIGISTGTYSNRGKLFIDEAKLEKALNEKPDEVQALFTGDGNVDGIGDRLYTEVNEHIDRLSDKAGSTTSLADNSTISKRLKDITKRIDAFEDKLTMIEDRYWREFAAMEKALNEMNAQSSWMMSNMFGGM
jgi:flagellar hook-associated protein 2